MILSPVLGSMLSSINGRKNVLEDRHNIYYYQLCGPQPQVQAMGVSTGGPRPSCSWGFHGPWKLMETLWNHHVSQMALITDIQVLMLGRQTADTTVEDLPAHTPLLGQRVRRPRAGFEPPRYAFVKRNHGSNLVPLCQEQHFAGA